MDCDEKLEQLYIDLPEPSPDVGSQSGAIICGKLLYVSGALPFAEGKMQHQGRVGVEVKADNARQAARIAAISSLALAKRALGGELSRIKRLVKLEGLVACGFDFRDQAKIVEGAGELFTQVFGANGKGARTVSGVTSLPGNACVEISCIFEIK